MPDLLLELFSEEIPARMQAKAADDLKKLVTDALVEAGLTYAAAQGLSTPRRLTLAIEGLTDESPTVTEDRKGPRADAPEKALEGFLRATGLTRDQLELRDDKKGQTWFAKIVKPGRSAEEILAEVIPATIRNFPWPKSMRWGAGNLRWVRPLHSILCTLTDENGARVVPVEIDGFTAGDSTEGHRFMAPGRFAVTSFDDYAAKLKASRVILSAEERADHIWHDATNMAFAAGMEVVEDKGLLAEVAGLVEWPVVLMGMIGDEFLDLPPEVLQTSMKEHQKFFSVKNPATGRIERFITVANVETADHGATILAGNGKVLAARLSDAKFFWENDLRVAKADITRWTDALENVTFHNRLGTQADRIYRIAALARGLASLVGADPDHAETAARIAKADLSSEMVYEFPELQGLMGRYYAEAAGYPEDVAAACEHHYAPLGPGDDVPQGKVSVAVALADKIDTLTGFWFIDEKPTGSKDPYALRRAALGVIRIVLAHDLALPLAPVLAKGLFLHAFEADAGEGDDPLEGRERYAEMMGLDAADLRELDMRNLVGVIAEKGLLGTLIDAFRSRGDAGGDDGETIDSLLGFLHDRLKVHLRGEGIRHDVIDACLAMPGSDDLALLVKRAEALAAVLASEDGENLVQGYKRAANILAQAETRDGVEYRFGADAKFAETDEERALFAALKDAEAAALPALEAGDFPAAMAAMAGLRAPIDAFFEAVQVNADNEVLRRNRLNLLHEITATCERIADLSRIEG